MSDVQIDSRPLSQTERLINIFLAPSKTFRDILRSSSWWLPFVILSLSSIAVVYTIDKKVGFDQVAQTQLRLNPSLQARIDSLEPPARAVAVESMASRYRSISYASPLIILAVAAFGSLILWATFNFALGARTTYSQILALWMYANLPRLLGAFITIITLVAGGSPENFNLQQPVGTNLAYYLNDAAPWLRAMLGFFDIIGIWVLFLLIIGAAIVAAVKTGRAATAIIGWWLLVLIASVGAAAAFS